MLDFSFYNRTENRGKGNSAKGKEEQKPVTTVALDRVYVCVHMPRECVCKRKDVHAYCSKMLAAQQKKTTPWLN